MSDSQSRQPTRQEQREKKLRKKREKMPQHGKSLGRIYQNAIAKKVETSRKKSNLKNTTQI
jgi:hypothetical protein